MAGTNQSQLFAKTCTPGFVFGVSPTVRSLNAAVCEIARTDIPVLLFGESGTGKDSYARLIHRLSPHHDAQFRKINCASVGLNELCAQLRSPERQYASPDNAETIYLDNIQELDVASQRLLLSLLPEEGSADSGDGFPARIISSTAVNLEPEVEAGRFRRELYFRLNGACLRLPLLRDRIEDVPAFVEYFLEKYSHTLKKNAPPLTEEVIRTLVARSWPGNIRELENLARKMIVFGDLQTAMRDFEYSGTAKPSISAPVQLTSLKLAARAASEKAERELILRALDRTHWNRKRAARELQISYKSLLYKIKQIGVSEEKHEN